MIGCHQLLVDDDKIKQSKHLLLCLDFCLTINLVELHSLGYKN